jgi:hypothetical protein
MPLAGGSVTTLVTSDEFQFVSIAVDATHIYWSQGGVTSSNQSILLLASANKDGTGIAAVAQPGRPVHLLVFSVDSLLWTAYTDSGPSVFKTRVASGATTSVATLADPLIWLGADAHGAFALTSGGKELNDHRVETWSALYDLSSGDELAYDDLRTFAAAMDDRYVYWSPISSAASNDLFRLRRSR